MRLGMLTAAKRGIGVLGCSVTLALGSALAQAPPAKSAAFEVVSIRQNVSGGKTAAFGVTPDGFRMVNMSLSRLVAEAYPPQSGQALYWSVEGYPEWVGQSRYDVNARIEEADRAEWQKPRVQAELLRRMLQTMLAERCGLAVHREQKSAPVYFLEVGKGGPKFKEAPPDEATLHGGPAFPGGGMAIREGSMMRFYQAPMMLLASFLTNRNLGGPEIQDRTGLAGRYDFAVEWGAWTAGVGPTQDEAADPGPTLFSAVKALGLRLRPAQGQVETLVVDHLERPSEN